jgi:hypothetical protein
LYPKELILSNAPVKFGGTQFAMTPLTVEDDEFRIKTRAIHSLFHRFQANEGVISSTFNINNMDEKEARLWIKLEWKALRKAINTRGDEQQLAIRDALIFRPLMKTNLKLMKDLQHLPILFSALIHPKSLRPGFLKISIVFIQWSLMLGRTE